MKQDFFSKLIFAGALALAGVIAIAFFVPELLQSQDHTHPLYSSMQRGGDPSGASVTWLGWAFGIVATFLIFCAFALGAQRDGSLRGLGWPIAAVFLATIAAWSAVIVAYRYFIEDTDQSLLFGFPLPTGLMIFVMLPTMFLINIVFVIWFPRSILTKDDLDKFERLVGEDDDSESA